MGGLRAVVAVLVWTAIAKGVAATTITYKVVIDPVQNVYIVHTLLSKLDTKIRGIQGGFSSLPYPVVSIGDVLVDSQFQLHAGTATYVSISLEGTSIEPGSEGALLSFKYGPSIDELEGQQVCPLDNLIVGDDNAQNIVEDIVFTSCLVLPPVSSSSCPITFANGDIDLNGLFTVTDIVQMAQVALEFEAEVDVCQITAADFNIDGLVDVLDVITGIEAILTK